MALNADILGEAMYNARNDFNNRPMDELLETYGNMEGVRLAADKAVATAIINHITTSAEVSVNVTTTGTAAAQTGTGTGTIL